VRTVVKKSHQRSTGRTAGTDSHSTLKNMCLRGLLILVASLAVSRAFAAEHDTQQPPHLPTIFVTSPVFNLERQQPLAAGKAFAVRLNNGRKILLSCLHLFGPAGGLNQHLNPQDLPDQVTGVTLLSLNGAVTVGEAGHELLRSGTPIDLTPGEDYSGDLVAFELPVDTPLGGVSMISTSPAIGTRVWLATALIGNDTSTANLYPGTVKAAYGTCTVVTLDSPVKLQACSGSPVLNSRGELVGMLLGHNPATPQEIFLNPGESIQARLAKEL
jgi:hypothetical protein